MKKLYRMFNSSQIIIIQETYNHLKLNMKEILSKEITLYDRSSPHSQCNEDDNVI